MAEELDTIDEIIIETPEADIEVIVSEPNTEAIEVDVIAMPGPQGPQGDGEPGGGGGGGPETAFNAGEIIGGTFEPLSSNGRYQQITNNGAFELVPPFLVGGNAWDMVLRIINGPASGAISTPQFDFVTGDPLTAADDAVFYAHIVVMPGMATMDVRLVSTSGGTGLDFSNPDNLALLIPLL